MLETPEVSCPMYVRRIYKEKSRKYVDNQQETKKIQNEINNK